MVRTCFRPRDGSTRPDPRDGTGSDSSRTSQGRAPSRVPRAPPVPSSRTASDRLSLPARDRAPGPGRSATRPDVLADGVTDDGLHSVEEGCALRRFTVPLRHASDRRHPYVDGVGPRVGRDLGVRSAEEGLAQPVGNDRFANARQAQGAQ